MTAVGAIASVLAVVFGILWGNSRDDAQQLKVEIDVVQTSASGELASANSVISSQSGVIASQSSQLDAATRSSAQAPTTIRSTPATTPSPTHTSAAAGTVRNSNPDLRIPGDGRIDLDATPDNKQWTAPAPGLEDLFYEGNNYQLLRPIYNAGLLSMGSTVADYESCSNATGYGGDVNLLGTPPGIYLCAKTPNGVFAAMQVLSFDKDAVQLSITTFEP